ncbi:MAG: hypothetical protein ACI8ZF_000030 [Candidatus Midichloriaceae bacterium]|jgi:hypothetical protein
MNFTEQEQEVIYQVRNLAEGGLDFPSIILGLRIEDAKRLQQLVDEQGEEFFKSYVEDKESYNLWEKLCDFIYNVFGYDYTKIGINGKNEAGATALFMLSGSEPMVNILLSMGADPNITNDKGETAIFGASCLNQLDVVKKMHTSGADLHIKNNNGDNILAALIVDYYPDKKRDLTEVLKYLVEQGVNPNEKNKDGKSAVDIAKESNYSHSLTEIFSKSRDNLVQR